MTIVVAPEGLIAQGVTIRREPFVQVYEEMLPLLRLHWAEIAHYLDIPLDVDVDRYAALDAAGALRLFIARLDGALVGYACFIVSTHAHYKGSLQAVQDVLYVDPGCRCSSVGLRLVRWCDAALAQEGVQVVVQHVKNRHPALGLIAARMGYEAVETIYCKRLDRARG